MGNNAISGNAFVRQTIELLQGADRTNEFARLVLASGGMGAAPFQTAWVYAGP